MDLVKLKIVHSSSPSLLIFARLFLKQISSLSLFNRQLGWKGKGEGEDAALPGQGVRGTAGSLQPTLPDITYPWHYRHTEVLIIPV